MNNLEKISINSSRKYDVIIGKNILSILGERIKFFKKDVKVTIITDSKVNEIYGDRVANILRNEDIVFHKFVFPNGEKSKNIKTLGDIYEFLASKRMNRNDLILALGGGVVGDIGGFAAATYLRGIDYIQIPTTFLAAIDSSVGGKTAIDLEAGKNLVGAFKQPIEVICDVETFKTLEEEVFADGVAEAIKYGILFSKVFFERFLYEKVTPDSKDIVDIVKKCVEFKRDIVVKDEFDIGERQLLNLGHTIGHAIEKCSNYKITHGHAVAAGMGIIVRATEKKGINEELLRDKIETALIKNKLPINSIYTVNELFRETTKDKKVLGSKINIIIPIKIGKCILYNINTEDFKEFISLGLEE